MKIKIASLITYLFLANCACAQVEGDALSAAPLDQAGYGEGNFTVSSFSARKAEADALKGHYRIRYAGRKNRIAAEKEESDYETPSYSEPGALTENTLDPSAASSVKTQQVSGMLAGGIGQKRGMGQRPGSSGLMAGMSGGMGAGARIGIGANGGLSMARGTSVAAVAGVGMGSGAAMRVMQNKVSGSMGGMGSAENTDASDELLQSDLGGSTLGSGITGSQSFSDLGR
jgi:hypothetical protein